MNDISNTLISLLASIAGNVFGMKRAVGLRLEDIYSPKKFLDHFKGSSKSVKGVREVFRVQDRPVVGTVPRTQRGLHTRGS